MSIILKEYINKIEYKMTIEDTITSLERIIKRERAKLKRIQDKCEHKNIRKEYNKSKKKIS